MRFVNIVFIRKFFLSKIGLIFLIIILASFVNGTWSIYQKAKFAKTNRDFSVAELEDVIDRETSLKEVLDRIDSKRGVEEEIRQTFDVGLEGEKLIVLVDTPEPEKVVEIKKLSVWERFVKFFGF